MTDRSITAGPSQPAAAIYELMGKVLAECPAIGKNQRNQAQSFSFRGIDDILDALNPILARHGVFYLPEVLELRHEVRVTGQSKSQWVVFAHVRWRFFAPDGSFVEGSMWGEGADSGDKACSKAMTMSAKSMLAQAFAISCNEEDPDGSGEESVPVPRDVFVEGGWAGKAEHDAARLPLSEAYGRLDKMQREAFAVFCKKHGVVANAPWSRVEAELITGFLEQAGIMSGGPSPEGEAAP